MKRQRVSDNGNAKAEDIIEQSRTRIGYDSRPQTAPRPSEEVIANLTPDQRRQVCFLRPILAITSLRNQTLVFEFSPENLFLKTVSFHRRWSLGIFNLFV